MSKDSLINQFSVWAIFALTAIAHFPLAAWLAGEANEHSQLTQSMIVLLSVSIILALRSPSKDKLAFKFGNECLTLLLLSYAAIVANFFVKLAPLSLAAICLAIASFLVFILGKPFRSLVYASMIGFFVYTNFVFFFPLFDWPLRLVAGEGSLILLNLIGQEASLKLVGQGNNWNLLLVNEGSPFHVAPECNGYGIITASLLMSLCLSIYQRFSLKKGFLVVVGTTFLAFLMNALRIVLIVVLAPIVGMDHYDLMHETVGLVILMGTIMLIWLALTEWLVSETQIPDPI